MTKSLAPINSDLFFSKNDPQDLRLGDIVKSKPISTTKADTIIIGYADDEGIKLNGGRVGASHAPTEIRRVLYKMTPHPTKQFKGHIYDAGNIDHSHGNIESRHEIARSQVYNFLKSSSRVLTLGGGHDYGYSDMAAFCEFTIKNKQKPVVINFDAHLDVRPLGEKGPHSGTPFFRLLSEFKGLVDFYEVGVQFCCNSATHWKWTEKMGAKIISLEEILNSNKSLKEILNEKILKKITKKHSLAVSIDIDGFSSSTGPGASQIFPIGINTNDFYKAFLHLNSKYKPSLLGIYEVSPPLDLDQQTSKLAAQISHGFLFT